MKNSGISDAQISVEKISCSKIEILGQGNLSLPKTWFELDVKNKFTKYSSGYKLIIEVGFGIELANNGHRATFESKSCFAVQTTKTDFFKNILLPNYLIILAELTVNAIAHARGMFIVRSIGSEFEGINIQFITLQEAIDIQKENFNGNQIPLN